MTSQPDPTTEEGLTVEERERLMDALSQPSHKREWFVVDEVQAILARRVREAAEEGEYRGIRLAATLIRDHTLDGAGERYATFLDRRADRRAAALASGRGTAGEEARDAVL